MSRHIDNNRAPSAEAATLIGALIAIGLVAAIGTIGQSSLPAPVEEPESTPVVALSLETAGAERPEVVKTATVSRATATAAPTPKPRPTRTPPKTH